MDTFALLVKSYRNDYAYAGRLLDSIRHHNRDSIPVYMVVPDDDLQLFASIEDEGVRIIGESLLGSHLVDHEVAGFSTGYINQEIVKLAFWELALAENYLCVDSDAEFIRDFHITDFMATPDVPFTFMTEDAELQCEPEYFKSTWLPRLAKLEEIRSAIGYQGLWPRTVHGHAVFSRIALQSFVEEFLRPRGWDYCDALEVSPYEPSWYTTWVLHAQPIPIHPREPIFKTFHNAGQHLIHVLRGASQEDIARGYVGVVVNSNYSRAEGIVPLSLRRSEALASYVRVPTLAKAIFYRFWNTTSLRRFGRSQRRES